MNTRRWARELVLLSLLAAGTAQAAPSGGNPLVDEVRGANDRFKDVAAAVAEGYAPIACASGADGGSMGVHYVNANYMKADALDIRHPGAIMYEPMPGGKMALIGVEYITFKGPAELMGHLLNYNGAPNRYGLGPYYELHVWAWKENPKGAFTDMNPNVSCDHMHGHGG